MARRVSLFEREVAVRLAPVALELIHGAARVLTEGELSGEHDAVFERHLAACADCRNYLDSYRETIRLSGEALEARPVVEEIPEELLRAILESKKC